METDYQSTNFIIYEILEPKIDIHFQGYTYRYFKTKITKTFQKDIDQLIREGVKLKGLEIKIGLTELIKCNDGKERHYNYVRLEE